MKRIYLPNLIAESSHRFVGMKNIRGACCIVFVAVIIGIGTYGCKKQEPQDEGISPSAPVALEEQTTDEQDKLESNDEIQIDMSIESAKWSEGKALAGSVAIALRSYIAEHGTNGDFGNLTVQKLFKPEDLRGVYFNINHFEISNVSFDKTRTGHPLHYTITISSPDDSWKIKSYQLLHTGQWIQTP